MAFVEEVKKLLDAIDVWRRVDGDVADNGWNKDNECLWDDAKDRMLALADEVRQLM